jgi:hypothetical protein
MRFGADGNLYTTDAGANATFTDMFRINIATGAASLVGMLADVPDFTLANSGSMLYGVGTAAGAPTSNLIGVNLNTFVPGGTNPDGSTAVITYELLTGNFQTDFNISSSQTFVVLPEPSTLGLCLAGGMILVVIHRRRGR